MSDDQGNPMPEESGGSLADAISQHLALKREHGADPDAVEHELEEALSPPRRDEPQAAAPVAEPEPAPEPVREPVREPEQTFDPEQTFESEPSAEPEPTPEPVEPEPEPISEEAVASSVEEPKPGEITGTIEFEFGEEEPAAKPEPEPVDEHDLLEDTPDFFEETPEHDKLWFDEAPPRKFDF